MVTTKTNHVLQCGSMTLSCRYWKPLPDNQHTWNNWNSNWTLAFNNTRNINLITAGKSFGQDNSLMEDKLSNQIINSLDNIVNSAVIRNNTVKSLVLSNKISPKTLKDLLPYFHTFGYASQWDMNPNHRSIKRNTRLWITVRLGIQQDISICMSIRYSLATPGPHMKNSQQGISKVQLGKIRWGSVSGTWDFTRRNDWAGQQRRYGKFLVLLIQ